MRQLRPYEIPNDINRLAPRDRLFFSFLTYCIIFYLNSINLEATRLKFNLIRKQPESQSQIPPSTAHPNLSCFIIRTI